MANMPWDPYNINLDAISRIESGFNPIAYNRGSGARGLNQITDIALNDYNQFHRDNRKTMNDMWDPQKNTHVAAWYLQERIPQLLQAFKLPVTLENVLWAYNGGIGNVKKNRMADETKGYINKYKKYDAEWLKK